LKPISGLTAIQSDRTKVKIRSQRIRTIAVVLAGIVCVYGINLYTTGVGDVFGSDTTDGLPNPDVFSAEDAISSYLDLVDTSEDSIFSEVEPILAARLEEQSFPNASSGPFHAPTLGGAIAEQEGASQLQVVNITIESGDNLSTLFKTHDISGSVLLDIRRNDHATRPLNKIIVGEKLEIHKSEAGELEKFVYVPNLLERFEYTRSDVGFTTNRIEAEIEYKPVYKYVTINDGESPITAGLRTGIRNSETILNLTKKLEYSIDFWFDIRPNDTYKILYNEMYLDGSYAEDADILAAEFKTTRGTHRILRYEVDGKFLGYYSPDGYTLKRQFLRAPLNYTRVSSDFKPKRLHPVHKVWRPHNGVDYAAPTGTPVRATADGTVKVASFNKANGNYVFLTHTGNYETRYLHFNRIAKGISKGVAVEQGQIIGYVGSTGYSTGPHLHYEFLIAGKHQNPRTVNLPEARELGPEEIETFRANIADLEARFDLAHKNWIEQSTVVAQTSE